MSLPPDLRVLCRKLTTASTAELPALCPILVNHILRCGDPLSASSEQANKANASEATVLVHKLKTQVNTLLHGKFPQGRFAGMVLAKAIVDVGGWECLRTSEPWVRGLLSLLQKPDAFASKELCVVVLARIYTLLQPYPTLVREIATPTIPTFANHCLQLMRQEATAKSPKTPLHVVETVTRTISALIPLYPTTFRPFSTQIRTAVRAYLAPTASDDATIPQSLMQSARRLVILLHYTAPKNGNAEEWSKLLRGFIQDAHATADQIFRAVRESRNPGSEVVPQQVSSTGEPHGGGDGPDDLPSWESLQSGAQRLIGLLGVIAEFFRCPTKSTVKVPLGEISDLVSRISLVLPPAPGTLDRDIASLINPVIGRDERDELWAALPNIHSAALELLVSFEQRMGTNLLPLIPEILEDAVRMFVSSRRVPQVREATFSLVQHILPLVDISLSRPAVDSLGAVIHACCQDILEAAGHAQQEKKEDKPVQNGPAGSKKKQVTANADLFLKPGSASVASSAVGTTRLAPAHLQAAEGLLAVLLLHLPQQHVKKANRTLMDRTAILSASREAMVSSVLHPYVDASGRHFANTIPFLARAYPHDTDLEILRSNLRTAPHYFGNIFSVAAPGAESEGEDEDEDEDEDEEMLDRGAAEEHEEATVVGVTPAVELGKGKTSNASGFALPTVVAERPAAEASAQRAADFEPLTLKRKPDQSDEATSAPKRVDTGKPAVAEAPADDGGDSDGDSDGSVELEMKMGLDGDDDESDDDN